MVWSAHSQVALDPCADQKKDCSAQGHPEHKMIFLYRTWSLSFGPWPERRQGSTRVPGHAFLAWHSFTTVFCVHSVIAQPRPGQVVGPSAGGMDRPSRTKSYLLDHSQPGGPPCWARPLAFGFIYGDGSFCPPSWEKALASRIKVYLRSTFLNGRILLSLLYKLRRGGDCPSVRTVPLFSLVCSSVFGE